MALPSPGALQSLCCGLASSWMVLCDFADSLFPAGLVNWAVFKSACFRCPRQTLGLYLLGWVQRPHGISSVAFIWHPFVPVALVPSHCSWGKIKNLQLLWEGLCDRLHFSPTCNHAAPALFLFPKQVSLLPSTGQAGQVMVFLIWPAPARPLCLSVNLTSWEKPSPPFPRNARFLPLPLLSLCTCTFC